MRHQRCSVARGSGPAGKPALANPAGNPALLGPAGNPAHSPAGNPALRWIGSALAAAATLVAMSPAGGCAGGGRRAPRTATTPYAGPDIRVDSSGPAHVVIFQAPSTGWSFAVDLVQPKSRVTEVYTSATRPNPAFMHAQVVTPLSVGTGVDARSPIAVRVRVLDHGIRPDAQPYADPIR